ncbi:hypothetical protein MKY30_08855 [Oceanobacillus sp. FSL W8-0428]|uniref:Uncharacterized protein n=1 Tax=Oceanobacillus sojae TaxID=582851 RepID=A0A511ZFB2_9BACI|nr:hypothetical protein [Oceanobacillus sojae]GEN86120.1 hypothetical protein OSO01_08590 [Oceanobacillus sojae]
MDKTDEPMKRMANLRLSHAGFAQYYKELLNRNQYLLKGNSKNKSHKHFFQKVHRANSFRIT